MLPRKHLYYLGVATLAWLSLSHPLIAGQSELRYAHVEDARDCPVKVVSAKFDGTAQKWQVGEVVLLNETSADVRRVAIKYVFQYANGRTRTMHRLWPYKVGEFQLGQKVETKQFSPGSPRSEPSPILEATVQIYHVDFYDGQSCGGDEDGFLAGRAAQNALVAAEKRRLVSLYSEKGAAALVDDLFSQPVHDEPATVTAFREMFQRAYRRSGLEGLLDLLKEP